jgi:hypothetical protein
VKLLDGAPLEYDNRLLFKSKVRVAPPNNDVVLKIIGLDTSGDKFTRG